MRPASSKVSTVALSVLLIVGGCQNQTMQRSQRAPQGADSTEGSSKKKKPDPRRDGEKDISPDDSTIEASDQDKIEETETADKPDETKPNTDDLNNNNNDPKTSKGTGGKSGLQEVSFDAANGQKSSYKINAPAEADQGKPYGLHIHLHGDGGGGYKDFPNKEFRENLIGISVKAPNRGLTWGRQEGVRHAEYLQDLIQNELLKKYNVQLERIFFSGVSGGAYFLTGSFIPQFGHHYNSGAFILCGGEAPRVAFAQPDMLKNFRIYWQVTAGERGDITSSIRQSLSAYDRALTIAIAGDSNFDRKKVQDTETKGPGGHCEFDDQSYTTGIQFILDTKFNVIFKK